MHIFLLTLRYVSFVFIILWIGQRKIEEKEVGRWCVDYAYDGVAFLGNTVRSTDIYKSIFSTKGIRLSRRETNIGENLYNDMDSDDRDSMQKILE